MNPRQLVSRCWLFIIVGISLLLLRLTVTTFIPAPSLHHHYPLSTTITAKGGEVLRITLTSDQQYRLWVPLQHIPKALREATLLYEDHWFYRHPGINPQALIRSAWMTYMRGGHQGGSTISMQVARMHYALNSRSITGKLWQIAVAFWLEFRYSKDALLETYLNLAPYGGNITGVAAASLIYFHKPVTQLTFPEALTLAVIPQNPVRRNPNRRPFQHTLPPDLLTARQRLWERWQATFPQDSSHYAVDFALPLTVYSKAEKVFHAPHVTQWLLQQYPDDRHIQSSIDLPTQQSVQRLVQEYVQQHRAMGVRNAAVVLLDTQSMLVQALVGSANFWDAAINGQVNGVSAKRSPGSTLKPFIYALALDQGLVHPRSILADTPIALGSYHPENFDSRFLGPLTVEEALIRSRNVPAVTMAAQLHQPSLYDFLMNAGVAGLNSEQHYGLSLALGGGEVTMLELAQLYALLRNQGLLRSLALRADHPVSPESITLLSPAAAYITLDMLSHNPRPDTKRPAYPTVAWKTGTSWGFKDAWAVGLVGRYVLVVWTGQFNSHGNTAFIGIQSAAPLFFRLVDSLRTQRLLLGLNATLPDPPESIAAVDVCAASGELPNQECPLLAKTWFIPGVSPIKLSSLHRAVYFDQKTGAVVCPSIVNRRKEVFEFWPEDMAQLFAAAGLPRRQAPLLPSCYAQGTPAMEQLDIVSPKLGGTYTLRSSKPATIGLRVNRKGHGEIFWFANKSFLGKATSDTALPWSPTVAQKYLLRAVDAQEHSASREVTVDIIP